MVINIRSLFVRYNGKDIYTRKCDRRERERERGGNINHKVREKWEILFNDLVTW